MSVTVVSRQRRISVVGCGARETLTILAGDGNALGVDVDNAHVFDVREELLQDSHAQILGVIRAEELRWVGVLGDQVCSRSLALVGRRLGFACDIIEMLVTLG